MKQDYDIKAENVHDYNAFLGVEDTHSLVNVIHYDDLQAIRHCRTLWGIYGIFLLKDNLEPLEYGSGKYNYSERSIVCVSPSQIGGTADDGTYFNRRGWALLFSPELFHGKPYEKELRKLEFFQYHVNEALTVNQQELDLFENLFAILKSELETTRTNGDTIIMKFIELILAYCSDIFKRQHPMYSGNKGKHIISRLEHVLDNYFQTKKQHDIGLPTVRYCATQLCIAPNYLGDLVKNETGESAHLFISKYIIKQAKSLLMHGKSITETAFSLGFDFPSHFGRLFKRMEGITPSEYLKIKLQRMKE